MIKARLFLLLSLALWLNSNVATAALEDTVHNLTATGPGDIKAPGVDELCVFCHTPHNANPAGALWNRELPGQVYTLYDSSTSKLKQFGRSAQPTGSSRLCLSCHDGTLALGNLRRPPRGGQVTLAPLTGRASVGVDLSDDHPVSFHYDRELAVQQEGRLAVPTALVNDLPLDNEGRLQCTTCHDPHEDPYRKFLRMDDRGGAFCLSCHLVQDWAASIHATSNAMPRQQAAAPWPADSPYATVAENGCGSCHRPHSAPGAHRLLSDVSITGVCLRCHNGNVAKHNLENEFQKFSAHPVATADTVHEPDEDPFTMSRHVTCTDCHHPHRTAASPTTTALGSSQLRGVTAIDMSGKLVGEASQEYEVCFKCHGLFEESNLGVIRQDNVRNVRVEISPANRSYHPVAAVGANPSVTGFEPGISAASIITCTDCHNNDEASAGNVAPRGPHGSRYAPLLAGEYQTDDPTPESAQSYELCYQCHNRSYLINDQAGGFSHAIHVVDQQAPCAACHDAHGSRDYPSLINFMLADRNGQVVVSASGSGRLEYNEMGMDGPECYLSCHGVDHDPVPGIEEDAGMINPMTPLRR